MKNKVLILGAGIGAMTIAFENAGCSVDGAYEKDKRAIGLYEKNVNKEADGYDHFFSCIPEKIPDIDILACDFFRESVSDSGDDKAEIYSFNYAIKTLLDYKAPSVICAVLSQTYLKSDEFRGLLEYINGRGYHYIYKAISTKEATGLPIEETRIYLVATRISLWNEYKFPDFHKKEVDIREELVENTEVDAFYYKVNPEQIDETGTEDTFLCWKQNRYVKSHSIDLNLVKIPLVRKKNVFRKITHRELARLKGIPDNYDLDIKNKAWMYRQLMYAPNVEVVTQIAKSISDDILENNVLQRSRVIKEQTFAELFERYLSKKCENVKKAKLWDFEYNEQEKDICFELKIYNSDYAIEKNIKRACQRLYVLKNDNIIILAVANIISEKVKDENFREYGIYIWDVRNLLWLFEEYSDIKDEFISLLTYSVDRLQLEIPEPYLFGKQRNETRKNTWEERLDAIQSGGESFREYENICTEILKNVLGEYLGLWAVQERSNNGLYRFDLCCKIKNGVNQDFFVTIQNQFNTKYIVFEFKNYEDKITQKEIYTTEKYLYAKALRSVAIIVSRKGADENALAAAKGCLRESGKLILCLSDEDLKELLRIKEKDEQPTAEFFEAMLDDLLIHLEK